MDSHFQGRGGLSRAAFLASNDTRWITGDTIPVSGGMR
jgi:hypothetical protein